MKMTQLKNVHFLIVSFLQKRPRAEHEKQKFSHFNILVLIGAVASSLSEVGAVQMGSPNSSSK